MARSFVLLPLLSILSGGLPAHAFPDSLDVGLSTAEMREVDRGQIVVQLRDTSESTLKDVLCVGRVDAGPERVWGVITDYEAYPRIFPRLLKSETRNHQGNIEDHYTLLKYPWPFDPHWTVNRITHAADHRSVTWRRVEGTVKEVVGSWRLIPEGNDTVVVYKVRLDPGVPLVPAWAIDWGSRHLAPQIIESVRHQLKTPS